MEQRYNIYFAGEVLEGEQTAEVRTRLARLFNADEQTLNRLFSGKAQILKRDCDKATALKYKQAMERAGARPMVKAAQDSTAPPPPAQDHAPAAPKAMSAAERIAALAAAPDLDNYRSDAGKEPANPEPAGEPEDARIAPAGADLLRPEERREPEAREVDTSGLEIGAPVDRLSPEPPPAPAAPDTSHLDMGQVGDTIPNLPGEEPAPLPHTLDIDLAPVGADFSEFAAPIAEDPNLDLSGIKLAPEGSDVLEEKFRRKDTPSAPPVDHISLQDSED